jgi:hydrogenase maturation factor HypF (carbamoyltransferase family)
MAFVLKLHTTSKQKYIANYVAALSREFDIKTTIEMRDDMIECAFDSEHENLQKCLDSLAQKLPASVFLTASSHQESKHTPDKLATLDLKYPLNLALCPSCQKELFDVSSRRYYYPFISCNCCGGNYSFLREYPYKRENTSFKFIRPCQKCEDEMQKVGLRESHVLNSCHECGVPVRLVNKSSERYANDAGSFRTMFEVAAKALLDNKRLLIKTTFGYRVFYTAKAWQKESILLMINASKITDNLALITEEFNALLSIERPIMHTTIQNEELKTIVGANTAYVKYPDEGFTILLATELQKLGVEYICYEDCDAQTSADIFMDYDLQVSGQ